METSAVKGSKLEIRMGGFGGQGIVLAGNILGKAAALYENKNVVFTQSYGPEARGGACSADVVLSNAPIHYPRVTRPQILVLMSQEAKNTYASDLEPEMTVIIDEDLVKIPEDFPPVKLLKVPATRLAEKLGRRIVANIVMLGFITGATGIVSPEAMRKALLSSIPKGTEELNLAALEKGLNYAGKLSKA
jgi:2-oxoglutarate ferredoxin oxidoreductase subunit gamma